MNDLQYAYIRRRIAQRFSIDIGTYKASQVRRRLESFIDHHAGGDPIALIKRADRDPHLRARLKRMLTINVSSFFRDYEQYEYLRSTILPELLEAGSASVWSAACSRGQEPYTLAMMLSELGERARVLATDIDDEALAVAKAGGPYSEDDVAGLSRLQKARYLRREASRYFVTGELRRQVVFRKMDLTAEAPSRRFQLIACRNVLIYFEAEAKARVFRMLHEALVPGGVLFVGSAEAPMGEERLLFERIDGSFYRKRELVAAGRR